MARGYTSTANIANALGQTFDAGQADWATRLMEPAESFVDTVTRRTWDSAPITITAEQHDLHYEWMTLQRTPVTAITSVLVRTRQVADVGHTLVAGTDYELQNAATGLLVIAPQALYAFGWPTPYLGDGALVGTDYGSLSPHAPRLSPGPAWAYALVTYTATQPPPADIGHATTLLVAHWMRTNLDPTNYNVESQKIGVRSITYATTAGTVPDEVQQILERRAHVGSFG